MHPTLEYNSYNFHQMHNALSHTFYCQSLLENRPCTLWHFSNHRRKMLLIKTSQHILIQNLSPASTTALVIPQIRHCSLCFNCHCWHSVATTQKFTTNDIHIYWKIFSIAGCLDKNYKANIKR